MPCTQRGRTSLHREVVRPKSAALDGKSRVDDFGPSRGGPSPAAYQIQGYEIEDHREQLIGPVGGVKKLSSEKKISIAGSDL